MEKKEFLTLTAQLFKEYGFIKYNNQFFLDLDRIVIRVYRDGARFSPGEYTYSYNFCLKDIHEDYKFETKDDYMNMPEDLGCYVYMCVKEVRFKDGHYVAHHKQFLPSDYTEEEWRRLWNEVLHKEFDPFKENFEEHIRKNFPLENVFGVDITAYKELLKRNLIFKE